MKKLGCKIRLQKEAEKAKNNSTIAALFNELKGLDI